MSISSAASSHCLGAKQSQVQPGIYHTGVRRRVRRCRAAPATAQAQREGFLGREVVGLCHGLGLAAAHAKPSALGCCSLTRLKSHHCDKIKAFLKWW